MTDILNLIVPNYKVSFSIHTSNLLKFMFLCLDKHISSNKKVKNLMQVQNHSAETCMTFNVITSLFL